MRAMSVGEMAADVRTTVAAARLAQAAWAKLPFPQRAHVLRGFRHKLADASDRFGTTGHADRGGRALEMLVAELLPLADACRFLEREAGRLLAPRRLGRRGRPGWLIGAEAEVRREPLGVVLVIGPDNYPLLLTAAPALQALAAGNAVLIKPAPGCREPALRFASLLTEARLPDGLCTVLGDAVADAQAAISAGVDHVVLTGSAATGRAVLASLAPRLVPATLELSGSDAVFVLPGADLAMVADALAFGLRFNDGATCIAPRRVFVTHGEARALQDLLAPRLASLSPRPVAPATRDRLPALLAEAGQGNARLIPETTDPPASAMRPTAVLGADPQWRLLREDVFAPVLSVVTVADVAEAVRLDRLCPYALGASIFGPEAEARELAASLTCGSVVINDLIVPTADPRLPFGGRRESGYGVTRGAEGLLAMTTPKSVTVRKGRFRPHYANDVAAQALLARAWLRVAHAASLWAWMAELPALLRALSRSARRQSGGG